MKKLSEFTGEAATTLIGTVLLTTCNILKNRENLKAYQNSGAMGLIGSALCNTPKEIIKLLAMLNEKPVEEYEVNAAALIHDAYEIFEDPELLRLFGMQS